MDYVSETRRRDLVMHREDEVGGGRGTTSESAHEPLETQWSGSEVEHTITAASKCVFYKQFAQLVSAS